VAGFGIAGNCQRQRHALEVQRSASHALGHHDVCTIDAQTGAHDLVVEHRGDLVWSGLACLSLNPIISSTLASTVAL
jgi:hypothetical protein